MFCRSQCGRSQVLSEKDITPDILKEAEVILGNLESPEQLQAAENLKWIQLNNAGTEGYCTPGILPGDALLTNATGAYGLAISEHMMACLFMLRKNWTYIMSTSWHAGGKAKAMLESYRVQRSL